MTIIDSILDCYLSLILVCVECMETIGPGLAGPHREQLLRLRKRLAFEPTAQALEESREGIENELRTFASRIRDYREVRADDLKDFLLLLAQAGDAFSIRDNGYSDQIRHLSRLLEQADILEHPQAAREKMRQQIQALRTFLDASCQDTGKTLDRMREQMEALRARTGEEPAVDPLTGLATRRELERQLGIRIGAGRSFCLLLFEMDASVNSSNAVGQEVLKQAAQTLACQVRARDFICRYDDVRLLVLLECAMEYAVGRALQMAQWLSGHYRIGSDVDVQVGFKYRIAEHANNESGEALLLRAETAAYAETVKI